MEKHLIITISEGASGKYGVKFICSFFSCKKDLKCTLFFVAPKKTANPSQDIASAWYGEGELRGTDLSIQAGKSLSTAKAILVGCGFPKEAVTNKVVSRQSSTAKEILKEGKSGTYDAAVLGRRGASIIETYFSESVTNSLMREPIDTPIWICRNPEEGRKNVLLCLDGSNAALRMADHVGYILGRDEAHEVTLFHVDRGQRIPIDDVFTQAKKRLEENNVSPDQIKTKVIKAQRVVKTVLQEAEKEKFAVVAVGMAGRHHSGFKNLVIGSKSLGLMDKIEKASLWVCR